MADPNKWLGLMKWSMKYSDGTTPSDCNEISKEDRDFLEKVLKEGVIDEVERITQILRILDGEHPNVVFAKDEDDGNKDQTSIKNEEKATEEDLDDYKEELLDELLTRIDQIDNAMNFVKLRGLPVMIHVLKTHERSSMRALAAEVCSVVVQNNPYCQDAALDIGLLEILCSMVKSPNSDALCQSKALLAISCLVRSHEKATTRFLSSSCKGLDLTLHLLQSNKQSQNERLVQNVQRKALFFLRYLIRESPNNARSILTNSENEESYIASIIRLLLSSNDVDLCESCLEALIEFANMGSIYLDECKKPEYHVLESINSKIEAIEGLPQDEQEYMSEVIRLAREVQTLLA